MPIEQTSNRSQGLPGAHDLRPAGSPHATPRHDDGRHGDRMRLNQACADFEALLIQKLFQTMRASVSKSGLIDGGSAEAIYTGMLDQQVAQDLALQGGLGLSAQVKAQIVKYMEKLST
jgi:Rod binding domain-containing protein